MDNDKDLIGGEWDAGDELKQFGVRIPASTIAAVKRVAEKQHRTIASTVDLLLRDAIYWLEKESEGNE